MQTPHPKFAGVVCLALALATNAARAAEPTPLNTWQLLADPAAGFTATTLPTDGWRPAVAGRSWNAQFDDLRDYFGVAWYKTTFEMPKGRTPHVLIRFGAVDYAAEIYVNGHRAGAHEGAYTPFSVDVADFARSGTNELLVRVVDPPPTAPGASPRFPEMPYEELPRGKQNWYIENAGLWQPVTLDVRQSLYVEHVHVSAKIDGTLNVDIELAGAMVPRPATIKVSIQAPDGSTVADLPPVQASTAGVQHTSGAVKSPQLWSPSAPVLYAVTASVSGPSTDKVTERFGFREFTARDGQFFLNGEPFYMRAALDQDFYPDSIYSTPDKAYVVDAMTKGRKLGLNLLRCHIKVCDPTYLAAADEVGMLVWYEVPSWDRWTEKSVARGRAIFDDMVARDWNHPSIVIQSLINEAWGIDMRQADQRAGLSAWFDAAKAKTAPLGRLIVDNSPCCDNFHVKSDIDDFHQYYAIPDNSESWDKWVADFGSRPKWSFSRHGDAVRTGQEPLVVSEFGNWGLPELPDALPWWFPRDFNGIAITRPAGLFDRFKTFGFDRLFPDYKALAREAEWRQFQSLQHEIEEIRRQGAIRGYVITEFTDINWEANGLMTMWRQPKIYANALADIQQDDVLLPKAAKTNGRAGDRLTITVDYSRYGATDAAGGTLSWSAGGEHGEAPVTASVPRAGVARIASIEVPLPDVQAPTRVRVALELKGAGGRTLARNFQDLFAFPSSRAPENVVVHDPAAALTALPWKAGALKAGSLVVTSALDAEVRTFVAAGGRALVVPRGVLFTFAATPTLSASARHGVLDGNWVSNFPWIAPSHPSASSAAVTPITGLEAAAATPRWLIEGVPQSAWQSGDVLAGMFFGWLNENHAVTAQFMLGQGKVIVTTFDVGHYADDPFTANLFNGLLSYLASDACQPKTALE
jgi:Glycosyl hydrolases family 2, sugar binding domain/Glycosyl hydrolases family 2